MKTLSKYKINQLENEYLFNKNSDIPYNEWHKYLSEDITDDIKYVILNKLDIIERGIILLYIYYNSNGGYNALAKNLGISVGTAHARIKEIKRKIMDNLR